MNKKWLILGTVSFSVGLSLSFVINRDIKQAALTGLLSVPATVAGVSVTEYQRRQKLNDKISTQQRQLQGLVQKEANLNNSIALLSEQVESLKQQEESITAVISTLNVDYQRYLQLATRSHSKLETIQNQVYELSNRKSKLEPEITRLEAKLRQLKEQEIVLTKSLVDLSNSQKQLQKEIFNLSKQKQTLAEQLNSQQHSLNQLQQQKLDLENEIATINGDQQELISNSESLRQQLQELEQKELKLIKSLENLSNTKIDLDSKLESDHIVHERLEQEILNLDKQFEKTQQQLSNEITALSQNVYSLESQKNSAVQELAEVESKKEQAQVNLYKEQHKLASIKEQINEQEGERLKLENILSALDIKLSNLPSYIDELEVEIEQLINQKNEININLVNPELAEVQIEFDFDELQDTVIETDLSIQRLQIEPKIVSGVQQDFVKQKYQKISGIKLEDQKERVREDILYIDNNYNIDNVESIKDFWNNNILPYWRHSDCPDGYRFLGNVDIQREESDRIINAVGKKLGRLKKITDSLEGSLLKIITFALSEYAYYYSEKDEGFWEGFCRRINIEYNQKVENTLREITKKGIELLGLIEAQGGYKYVSTLWLQSGIPKKNMEDLATIVQAVANEHDWWEISHSSAADITQILWQFYNNSNKEKSTIKHFLKIDNTNEDIEPISGQLVKNIAIVARELERQNISPETLQNKETREEILNSLNLSYGFFLRDWSDFITILTPRTGKSDRSIFKRRNKPPYLYLDIANTLNTLLILPEQSLWKKQWQNLRDTYCQIPEAGWEDDIPSQGDLEIPELQIKITQATEKWTCELQNDNRNQIYKWEYKGINSEFPCLIFDSISGEHIQIDLSDPKIFGIEEIILFTPKEIKIEIELDSDIEVIDHCVHSSINGWRGKEIKLIKSEASIQIQNVIITWKLREQEQLQLKELRLKGKKVVYLETPTLYYPPQKEDTTINCLIESIDTKEIIARNCLKLFADDNWSEIDLSQCIKEQGNYQATFWQQEKSWSYRFEVREEYQITRQVVYRNLAINNHHNNLLSIPAKYKSTEQFWAEVIKINNLYPLEELTFNLKSDREQYIFYLQADSLGELTLSLATLYSYLPKCDRYTLDLKQSGAEFKSILQVGYSVICKPTATEVIVEE